MPKEHPQSAAVQTKRINSEAISSNAEELKLTGPDVTGKTCAQAGCSNSKHCKTNYFRNECQLKATYLNTIVADVDKVLKTITPLRLAHALLLIPTADILHDIAKTNYFSLSDSARSAIDVAVTDEPYVNQLALLYFIVISHRKLTHTFPEIAVEYLHEDVAFTTKAEKLKVLSQGLAYDGRTSNLTLKNAKIAGIAIAAIAAGLYVYNARLPYNEQVSARILDYYKTSEGMQNVYKKYVPTFMKSTLSDHFRGYDTEKLLENLDVKYIALDDRLKEGWGPKQMGRLETDEARDWRHIAYRWSVMKPAGRKDMLDQYMKGDADTKNKFLSHMLVNGKRFLNYAAPVVAPVVPPK